jgi:site-specific recombinase XerD
MVSVTTSIPAVPTVTDLIDDYLRCIRPTVSGSTWLHKEWQLTRFLRYLTDAQKRFFDVRRADIEAYLATMRHCTSGTQRDNAMAIRDLYVYVHRKHPALYPYENPVSGMVFRNYKSRSVQNVPGEAAIHELLDHIGGPEEELRLRNRLMAELAYGSGLRRGEIEALNIEDIDFEEKRAYVTGKGGRTRIVPLTGTAIECTRAYMASRRASRGPLIVSRRGRRIASVTIGYVFRKSVGIRPHLLRHAFATHLLKNGCGIRIIQELLGHKELTTTQVYTHIIQADVAEAVKRLHPRSAEG